jgi:hypothetical protein
MADHSLEGAVPDYGTLPAVIEDLGNGGLMPLGPGERLWKLYFIRPASGRATALEHRIYTKRKVDGSLALVSFAIHAPAEGSAARSGAARVPDLPAAALDRIVAAIRREASPGDEYREVDLSGFSTLDEQLARLRELHRVQHGQEDTEPGLG